MDVLLTAIPASLSTGDRARQSRGLTPGHRHYTLPESLPEADALVNPEAPAGHALRTYRASAAF
jgi:hypothetical protein